jgi:hypothetical protein
MPSDLLTISMGFSRSYVSVTRCEAADCLGQFAGGALECEGNSPQKTPGQPEFLGPATHAESLRLPKDEAGANWSSTAA